MSDIVDIMDLDESEYEDLLPEDIRENIEREYFSGLLSREDYGEAPNGGIIWQLCGAESEEDTSAEILYLKAPDRDALEELFEEFNEKIADDEVNLVRFELKELDDDLKSFLAEDGFEISKKESRDLRITLKDAAGSKIMGNSSIPGSIRPLSELELIQYRQGITNCLFAGETGLYDDLAMLPREWYDQDISCVYMAKDRVDAVALVHASGTGALMPVLLHAQGQNADKTVLYMLRFCINAALEKYPKDTEIIIRRNKDRTGELTSYLFPKKKGDFVIAGEKTYG